MAEDDLLYNPSLDRGIRWISDAKAERVLVRGELTAEYEDRVERLRAEVRQLPPSYKGGDLHVGVYGVKRRGRWEALVVTGEQESVQAATAQHRFTDDGPRRHLALARDALVDQWEDGLAFLGSSPFAVDDVVKLLGSDRIGRVRSVIRTGTGHRVDVLVDGQVHSAGTESLQRVDGDPRDPEFWVQGAPAGSRDVALTLTWTKIRQPLTNTLYSYKASKTLFRPYQFIPALKILNSATGRLLIADEVGLGKTIEAGIVWSELEQRSPLRRTLVVAPSALALKWRMEMSRRFDRELEVIKPPKLIDMAERLLEGDDPRLHAVISLESLRTAYDALDTLARIRPRFDLIIVDEAHALRNLSTKSNILGGLLSDWADHLLFLSATPINLRSEDLYNLLTLLDEGLFQDAAVFQLQLEPNRHLNDVARRIALGEPGVAARESLQKIRKLKLGGSLAGRPDFRRLEELVDTPFPLPLSERSEVKRLVGELNTLSGILSRTRKIDVPNEKAVREPHQIEVNWTPSEKRFYDSIVGHFMARALKSGTPPGFAMQMPLRQAASCLPAMQHLIERGDGADLLSSTDDLDEDVSETEVPSLSDLSRVVRLEGDSKYDALLQRLLALRQQGVKQAMIFSTFRGTISYLVKRLRQHFTVRELHGGIPMRDRQPIIDAFRDGEFELLVASEVASEGLDFEFCNVLVNYDLPWNPMRVEQRIGRLDRFGQKHEKILILNMHVPGTIESDILARLYSRIGIFESSIGDLEPILRDELRDVAKQLLDPRLDDRQRRQRADEIAMAIERRSADIRRLEEERATLSTVEQLTVEGLTEAGPSGGRYIGASEIESLVRKVVEDTGGSLKPTARSGHYILRGTSALSDLVWRAQTRERGSRASAGAFSARLRNGELIDVTFNADLASARDIELLSVRHPLVEVAVDHLETDALRLRRYGVVEVPGLPAGHRYGVTVDLVEQTGIRPTRELWATAIDLSTREVAPEVGTALLAAVASGSLQEPTWGSPTPMSQVLPDLHTAAWTRRDEEEPRRRQDNEAMAKARLDARVASLEIKLQKAKSTLHTVQKSHYDPRVVRMHQGRVRNIQQDMDRLRSEHEKQLEFSLTMRTVAVLEVIGPAT